MYDSNPLDCQICVRKFYYLNLMYPGVEHVEGDMFEAVPKGEVLLLKVSVNY